MPNHHSNKVTTRSRRQKTPKSIAATSNVEFHSILRVRPLLKKEKEDHLVLEPAKKQRDDAAIAVLHPLPHLSSPDPSQRLSGNLSSPKFVQGGRQEEYHFDKILDVNASQDSIHYLIGLKIATNAMEPLVKKNRLVHNHVALVMGLSNAGKTYTTFGNLKELARPNRNEQDGLVPRILESLFAQSKHHVSRNKSFAVRMSLLHVENDQVHDLLATDASGANGVAGATPPSAKKKGVMAMVASFEGAGGGTSSSASGQTAASRQVKIEQDPTTHDYIPDALIQTCWTSSQARKVLQAGLNRGLSSKFAGLAKGHSRGHTLITIQPVLIRGSKRDSTAVDRCGGTITFLDMGTEKQRAKKSRTGGAMRDAIANNSSFAAIQHVLRSIKHNQDVASGKLSSLPSADEDVSDGSDISCVSEPKGSSSSKAAAGMSLKAVPYRQSKVTMLLQPLFSSTGHWNLHDKMATTVVTTMLTAYPGHRDYAEKRSLLNDIELLLGSDIARRMTHTVSTGLETTPVRHSGNANGKTMDEQDNEAGTSQETSSLEMSSSDDEELEMQKGYTISAPSAPTQAYDNDEDMPISALPPPYAPGSSRAPSPVLEASAPPIDEVYHSGTIASRLRTSSPADRFPVLSAPVSSQQRRAHVVDLPGVTLPANAMHYPTPKAVKDASNANSGATPSLSHRYTSPPLSNSRKEKQSKPTVKASISSTPNIQPPQRAVVDKDKENAHSSLQEPSPNRNWKESSPMKTISRAVHSSKKKGKRAIENVERTVAKRLSNEFEPKDEASFVALSHRVKVLERENAKLKKKNASLTSKCEELTAENEAIKRSVQESKMQWRKDCWSLQDEQEWQHSKRIRMEEQDLIRSPLREHLESVQTSYDNCNQWMTKGSNMKVPFSLSFPSHFVRAKDLDERDRAMVEEGTAAPPSTPAAAHEEAFAPNSSNQKRTQLSAFKKRLDVMGSSNKKYKPSPPH